MYFAEECWPLSSQENPFALRQLLPVFTCHTFVSEHPQALAISARVCVPSASIARMRSSRVTGGGPGGSCIGS